MDKKILYLDAMAETGKTPFNYLVAFWGMLVAGFGIFLALSCASVDLHLEMEKAAEDNITGLCGAWLTYFVVLSLGYPAAYLAAGLFFVWGALIVRRSEFWETWTHALGGIFLIAAAALIGGDRWRDSLFGGGLLYRAAAPYFEFYLGKFGSPLIAGLLIFIGGILAFGNVIITVIETICHKIGWTFAALCYRAAAGFRSGIREANNIVQQTVAPTVATVAAVPPITPNFSATPTPKLNEYQPLERMGISIPRGDRTTSPRDSVSDELNEIKKLLAQNRFAAAAKTTTENTPNESIENVAVDEKNTALKELSPHNGSAIGEEKIIVPAKCPGRELEPLSEIFVKQPINETAIVHNEIAEQNEIIEAANDTVAQGEEIVKSDAMTEISEVVEPDEAAESQDEVIEQNEVIEPDESVEFDDSAAEQDEVIESDELVEQGEIAGQNEITEAANDTVAQGEEIVKSDAMAEISEVVEPDETAESQDEIIESEDNGAEQDAIDGIESVKTIGDLPPANGEIIAEIAASALIGEIPMIERHGLIEFAPAQESEVLAVEAEVVFDNDHADDDNGALAAIDTMPFAAPRKLVAVYPQPVITKPVEPKMEIAPLAKDPYILPPLSILDEPPPPLNADIAALERRATQLIRTLNHFKIQGQVISVQQGPRITQFEISIAAGIPVSKIRNLADNIAMDLRAISVRIIAPIPGRDTIGIEIPNLKSELVALKEIVAETLHSGRKQTLPLCLAKDVAGNAIVADLAKMPHLLIAGSTGSGKSVCINSIIMSFLMCMTPEECKLIMVDPKVVELSRFHDIPHLMSPVITDMQKAVGVLEWACQEMDERYEKLSMVSVNNLEKFNSLSENEITDRVRRRYGESELENFPRRLPCIVIIIDELADLMMVAKKEVEHHIARLAAKSRAVGIHLILATQRPSADVITGLIKANMPSRIAFQVASKLDSRIILDQSGADALLGQGDMLYLPPGTGKVQRAQGVFVSDDELFKIVDYCKAQRDPEYHSSLEGPVIGSGRSAEIDLSQLDELFYESGEAIIEEQRGSVSLLQRKFGIGYGRAARIVDQLAECGVLGPFRGSGKPRDIIMELAEFQGQFGDTDRTVHLAGLRADER